MTYLGEASIEGKTCPNGVVAVHGDWHLIKIVYVKSKNKKGPIKSKQSIEQPFAQERQTHVAMP